MRIIGRRLTIYFDDSIIVIEKRGKANHQSDYEPRRISIDVNAESPLHLENIVERWDLSEGYEPIGKPLNNSYGQTIESYLTGDEFWLTAQEWDGFEAGDLSLERFVSTPKRPNTVNQKIMELFRLINSNNLDEAKIILDELREIIGGSEPELIRAETTIKRREIIGR
jgi:hypothetical protein